MRRRGLLALLLASVVLAGLVFLFILPGRTYLSQKHNLSATAARIQVLGAENGKLQQRVKQLQTDAEVERLARERYGLVKPGEQAYAILPPRPAPARPPAQAEKSSHHPWWEFWK